MVVATDSEAIATAVEKAGRPRGHDARRPPLRLRPHLRGARRSSTRRGPASSSTCRATCRPFRPTDIRAALAPLADPAVDIATLAAEIRDEAEQDESERGQVWSSPERSPGARRGAPPPPARALFHPRDRALRRRAALPSHRALRLSPRRARALRRAAAVAARAAREARAAARARSRHAHRRRHRRSRCRSASIRRRISNARAPCCRPAPVDLTAAVRITDAHEQSQKNRIPGRARRQFRHRLPPGLSGPRAAAVPDLRGRLRGDRGGRGRRSA